MKWYHFIFPAFVINGALQNGDLRILLLLFACPFFWLHPAIDAYLGPDPQIPDRKTRPHDYAAFMQRPRLERHRTMREDFHMALSE